jgi:phosphate transport system substrate-binding protein
MGIINPLRRFAGTALLFCCALVSMQAYADIRISGSDTEESLFTAAIAQYKRSNNIDITAQFKGTGAGLKDLCDGKADIVPASTRIQPDQAKACTGKKIVYVELPIAYDAVAVIVNKSNNWANDLTMPELKSIFHPELAGKSTRWSQIRAGYKDTPLNIMSLDIKSGTTALFTERVVNMRSFVRGDANTFSDHAKLIDAVSADINAIGFVSLGALVVHPGSVRSVPVNFGNGAVVPDASSVLSQAYAPLTRLLYVYIAQSALAKPDVKAFARYLFENGDRYARFAGFVPLVASSYIDSMERIKTGQ